MFLFHLFHPKSENILKVHFRPRCSYDRPCGQGEVDQQHSRWTSLWKLNFIIEMAKLWGALFPIYRNVIAGPLCKQRPQPMQGSRQRCRGSGRNAVRCWVSQQVLCVSHFVNFFLSKFLSLSGHGSQLRDFPTTLKVLAIQVTSMQSERRWKNVKQSMNKLVLGQQVDSICRRE